MTSEQLHDTAKGTEEACKEAPDDAKKGQRSSEAKSAGAHAGSASPKPADACAVSGDARALSTTSAVTGDARTSTTVAGGPDPSSAASASASNAEGGGTSAPPPGAPSAAAPQLLVAGSASPPQPQPQLPPPPTLRNHLSQALNNDALTTELLQLCEEYHPAGSEAARAKAKWTLLQSKDPAKRLPLGPIGVDQYFGIVDKAGSEVLLHGDEIHYHTSSVDNGVGWLVAITISGSSYNLRLVDEASGLIHSVPLNNRRPRSGKRISESLLTEKLSRASFATETSARASAVYT